MASDPEAIAILVVQHFAPSFTTGYLLFSNVMQGALQRKLKKTTSSCLFVDHRLGLPESSGSHKKSS
jgi:hypothetical protein